MEDFEVWGVSTPATVSPSPDGASRGQRRAQVWKGRGIPAPQASTLWGVQGWGHPGVWGERVERKKETELEEDGEEGRQATGSRGSKNTS